MSRFHFPGSRSDGGWRQRFFTVIFGHDTPAGRVFDVALIMVILASVAVALADSVSSVHARHGDVLYLVEWSFTLVFTVEYVIRLLIVKHPMRYARSFYGIIDLLALLPTYLSLFVPGAQYLAVLRVLRILRIFEILHLRRYTRATSIMLDTLYNSWRKILVFLMAMLSIITVFGALMYLIEGPEHGFTSIPTSMYWALVSVSTVGFGDITPETVFGRLAASVLILIGYGIIAVPTGIYTAELATSLRQRHDGRGCSNCDLVGHDPEAAHCRRCGHPLPSAEEGGSTRSEQQ